MYGERMKHLRVRAKITQEELSDALCISRTAVAGYEGNKWCPNADVIKAYAKFFGVSADWILGLEVVL